MRVYILYEYHNLYYQQCVFNLSTSAGCELDDIYLHSSVICVCAESHSGGNVLCAVRRKIWAVMCLIVLLWCPDGFENIILMIFSSCSEAAELKELQFHILMFYTILFFLKCLDVILTYWGVRIPASCFVSVWSTIIRHIWYKCLLCY